MSITYTDRFNLRHVEQSGADVSFEIRVDGVTVAEHPLIETALRAAVERKSTLPQQLVALHDRRFGRTWVVDHFGRVNRVQP